MDDITGLYDHGARNRNPITAVWYGIDELFEKSPENGPYGYCGGNPVKYFDPDGRERYIFNEDGTFARVIYKEEGVPTSVKGGDTKILPSRLKKVLSTVSKRRFPE